MKKKIFSTLLCLLLCPLLVLAEFTVPERKIEGADRPIGLGELVDLTITPMPTPPDGLLGISYNWIVLENNEEKRVRQVGDGVFFGAGITPKKVFAICLITYTFGEKDEGGKLLKRVLVKTVRYSTTITIGKPGPEPSPTPTPPEPGPTPQPEPYFPVGTFGLAKFAYENAKGLSPKGATALATSFEGIAAKIAAGTVSKPEDILGQTKQANNAALLECCGSTDAWDGFSTNLQNKLFELYQGGKLKEKSDYQTAWKEIAEGLRGVR